MNASGRICVSMKLSKGMTEMDDEYMMFTPATRWVEVNNLNGIIERPDELLRYINQALEAGRIVFGERFEVELQSFQRAKFS